MILFVKNFPPFTSVLPPSIVCYTSLYRFFSLFSCSHSRTLIPRVVSFLHSHRTSCMQVFRSPLVLVSDKRFGYLIISFVAVISLYRISSMDICLGADLISISVYLLSTPQIHYASFLLYARMTLLLSLSTDYGWVESLNIIPNVLVSCMQMFLACPRDLSISLVRKSISGCPSSL